MSDSKPILSSFMRDGQPTAAVLAGTINLLSEGAHGQTDSTPKRVFLYTPQGEALQRDRVVPDGIPLGLGGLIVIAEFWLDENDTIVATSEPVAEGATIQPVQIVAILRRGHVIVVKPVGQTGMDARLHCQSFGVVIETASVPAAGETLRRIREGLTARSNVINVSDVAWVSEGA